jgi:hypothetical protein
MVPAPIPVPPGVRCAFSLAKSVNDFVKVKRFPAFKRDDPVLDTDCALRAAKFLKLNKSEVALVVEVELSTAILFG